MNLNQSLFVEASCICCCFWGQNPGNSKTNQTKKKKLCISYNWNTFGQIMDLEWNLCGGEVGKKFLQTQGRVECNRFWIDSSHKIERENRQSQIEIKSKSDMATIPVNSLQFVSRLPDESLNPRKWNLVVGFVFSQQIGEDGSSTSTIFFLRKEILPWIHPTELISYE